MVNSGEAVVVCVSYLFWTDWQLNVNLLFGDSELTIFDAMRIWEQKLTVNGMLGFLCSFC